MRAGQTERIFTGQSTATISLLYQVDNFNTVMLLLTTDSGTPVSQKVFVYGSLLKPGTSLQIDPTIPTSPTNPYAPLMVRDINDLSVFNGTDGITLVTNQTRLYEVNTNAVRNLHFVISGSGAGVYLQMRPYDNSGTT